MTDGWAGLRERMLDEPKPAVTAVCVDAHEGQRISVVHDGRDSWRLDDGRRTFVSDGSTTILVEEGRTKRFQGVHVYCMPLPQSMIHPRRFRDLGGPAAVTGHVAHEGRPATVVRLSKWARGAGADLVVDDETGMILALARLDAVDQPARLEELAVGAPVDPDLFVWNRRVDEEIGPTAGPD